MLVTVLDYLNEAVRRCPDKVAFVEQDRKITYVNFQKESLKVSSYIMNHVENIHRPILVRTKNTINALIAFMGIAYSGNIYVPIAFDMPDDRLEQIKGLVVPEFIIDSNNERHEGEVQLEDIISEERENFDEGMKNLNKIVDTDPLYILFTSGSTGIPKGVTVSHAAVIDFTEEASETMELTKDDAFLNQGSFYFDLSVMDIYCTIRNMATLHLVDHRWFSYPIKIVDYIEKNKISVIYWVPSALVAVANLKALGKRDLSSLRLITFCGEVMPTKQYNLWKTHVPNAKYINYYGPCETCCASIYYIDNKDFLDDEPIPIGKPAKNTKVILLDENNSEIKDTNILGEILIGGRGVALGYYHDINRTKSVFVQNPLQNDYTEIFYRTGDLGHYGEDGNLHFDGRRDYQIKRSGYRIELGDIEVAAGGIEEVDRVACVYSANNNCIALYYTGAINEANLMAMLKGKLQPYMIPNKIIKINKFELNSNGKIDRKTLLKQYEELL